MRTFPYTPAGMKAAQRTYDAQENADYYSPPRRRNRTITLATGEEISDADVDQEPTPREEDED